MFKTKTGISLICLALALVLTTALFGSGQIPAMVQSAAKSSAVDENALRIYSGLPLLFMENDGQLPADAPYYAIAQGQSVMLTKSGIVFDVAKNANDRFVFSLTFENANSDLNIAGLNKAKGVINYLLGNDPVNWKTSVPTYQEVLYSNVYPNIDMRLYGDNASLRYDFIVKPGASVDNIALAYQGINSLNIVNGELVAATPLGDSSQQQPYMYQEINNQKVQVEGGFKILANTTFGFEAGNYDTSEPLIIDPTIAYSTYFGGTGDDSASCVAVGGPSGNAYIGGTTTANFPTKNGFIGTYQGGTSDGFVAEVDTTSSGASSLIYCTYIGGNGNDIVNGIGVTPSGAAYITGSTTSANFPTLHGYQSALSGAQNSFLTALLPNGSGLSYSTYFGGSGADSGNAITIDPATGIAYFTGATSSANFPTLNAYQSTFGGGQDAFVTAINPALSGTASLLYSTYLGGSGIDIARSITMLSATDIRLYIGGDTTSSTNFPTKGTPQPMQAQFYGTQDGFVACLFPAYVGEVSLYYSSYIGGGGKNSVTAVAICPSGCLYATGWTDNAAFPMMLTPAQSYQGGIDGFFVRVHPAGDIQIYSSYIGGSGDDYPTAIYGDPISGSAVITGYTTSPNFPTTNATQITPGGGKDAFVVRVNPFAPYDPAVNFTGGGGTDATARANVASNGTISDIQVTSGGTGYTSAPNVTITGVVGSGATATATVAGGVITAITVNNHGSNYTTTNHYPTFILYGSYLGGSGDDMGKGITLDSHGGAIVVGDTTSANFPTLNPYQANFAGGARDAFITNIGGIFASVTTGSASLVTLTSARLNGNLTAMGTGWGANGTNVQFEWGTSSGTYPNVTTLQPETAIAPFFADITGLTAGTIYYYRAKVIGDGTTWGVEKTFTTTAASGAAVNVSVGLQGGGRPDAGWIIPLTVKFFTPGADVLAAAPVYQSTVNTSKSGTTALASVTGVPAGTYDVTVASQGTLINKKVNVVVTSSGIALDMGTLLEGNANDDNYINMLDFSTLAAAFGKSSGTAGYDARADFDRNGVVNMLDFSLLAANFGKTSPVIIP